MADEVINGLIQRQIDEALRPDPATALLARQVEADIQRATGRRYRVKLAALDAESLRELHRLLRDLDHEKRAAANRARMMPWRRP